MTFMFETNSASAGSLSTLKSNPSIVRTSPARMESKASTKITPSQNPCGRHNLCGGVILVDALLSIRAGEVLTIDGLLFKVDNDPALAEFVSNMKVMYGRRASVLLDYLFTAG